MPITVTNLTCVYGAGTPFETTALRDVSVTVENGSFVGILGRTGCGKSTLIQIMAGLLTPTAGTVMLDGQDIHARRYDRSILRRKVGIVFQYPECQLFETTVEKDVAFGLKHSGLSAAEKQARVRWALETVGFSFEKVHDQPPMGLSGGEKRRVAIAGVLAMRPQCIVLDEATAMLDPIGRSEVISTIERLNRDEGITVVLITHHMNEAEHADRVIVMNEGRVAMDGAPREVFAQVEKLKSIGLTVPDTVELLYELRGAGCDLPLTAITVDECADAIARCFGKSAKEDN